MTSRPRRLLVSLCAAFLAAAFELVPTAQAATPVATFVSPTPGWITVTNTTSYSLRWTIASGTSVSSETLVTQTSRPLGVTGCDLRWAPAGSTSVTGNSYQASGYLPNRCYRFLLYVTTPSGTTSVISPTWIPYPAGLGPTADFTNPVLDGVVAYETTQRVGWAQRDTFGSTITSRSFFEETAAAIGGSCAGVTWSNPVQLAVSGTSISRTLQRSSCYRYRLNLQDAAGFRSELVSGSMPIAAALPAWSGTVNFYRAGAFASQATNTWCVAASSQMMLNMVLGQSDSTSANQQKYMVYAQANDGGNYSVGSNPAGWSAVMDRYGGSSYSVQTFGDRTSALKRAALRMRLSNKPVGMLVWSGTHAWVMNGFSATADPATTSDFTVTQVFVTGPLYPRTPNSGGYDQPPNTVLTPTQLTKYFLTYSDSIVRTWNGTYVLVMP